MDDQYDCPEKLKMYFKKWTLIFKRANPIKQKQTNRLFFNQRRLTPLIPSTPVSRAQQQPACAPGSLRALAAYKYNLVQNAKNVTAVFMSNEKQHIFCGAVGKNIH